MTSIETSGTRTTAVGLPTSSNWEKEFFTTWLRLMERQKDETDLTQALQSLLTQDGDATTKLQDAKHHANMMSANDKTMTELVAQLNDFFFRDIVPALKKMRQAETTTAIPLQRHEDPLDRYLEHGDDGTAMSQAFVDDMSGWAVPVESADPTKEKGKDRTQKKTSMKKVQIVSDARLRVEEREGDVESENDEYSDDEIPSDMFHDMLIANSLKLTAMQGPDYPAMTPQQVAAASNTMVLPQGSTARSRTSAHLSAAAAAAGISRTSSFTSRSPDMTVEGKVKEASKHVPSPTLTYLSSRSRSGSGSLTRTDSHSPSNSVNKKGRIAKGAAASLVAEQVLDVRTCGKAKEYFIRWQGVSTPLWIARCKCSRQARELIDAYAASLRRRDSTSAFQKHAQAASHGGRKRSSRYGANVQDGVMGDGSGANEVKFYTVDHIVNHRMRYNKRQYLVRWENYSESQDTWENADKLRVDVPDIVDAYEEKLQRRLARGDGDPLALSDAVPIPTKRSTDSEDKSTTQFPLRVNRVAGEKTKAKRRRITIDDHGKRDDADEELTSKDDHPFDLEAAEAELSHEENEEVTDNI